MNCRRMELARQLTVLAIGRDKRGDGDGVAVREQFRNLRDAPDVLIAVRLAEAEVLVEAEADVVAVQSVGGDIVLG